MHGYGYKVAPNDCPPRNIFMSRKRIQINGDLMLISSYSCIPAGPTSFWIVQTGPGCIVWNLKWRYSLSRHGIEVKHLSQSCYGEQVCAFFKSHSRFPPSDAEVAPPFGVGRPSINSLVAHDLNSRNMARIPVSDLLLWKFVVAGSRAGWKSTHLSNEIQKYREGPCRTFEIPLFLEQLPLTSRSR
jgi:hypothetical protein